MKSAAESAMWALAAEAADLEGDLWRTGQRALGAGAPLRARTLTLAFALRGAEREATTTDLQTACVPALATLTAQITAAEKTGERGAIRAAVAAVRAWTRAAAEALRAQDGVAILPAEPNTPEKEGGGGVHEYAPELALWALADAARHLEAELRRRGGDGRDGALNARVRALAFALQGWAAEGERGGEMAPDWGDLPCAVHRAADSAPQAAPDAVGAARQWCREARRRALKERGAVAVVKAWVVRAWGSAAAAPEPGAQGN